MGMCRLLPDYMAALYTTVLLLLSWQNPRDPKDITIKKQKVY